MVIWKPKELALDAGHRQQGQKRQQYRNRRHVVRSACCCWRVKESRTSAAECLYVQLFTVHMEIISYAFAKSPEQLSARLEPNYSNSRPGLGPAVRRDSTS